MTGLTVVSYNILADAYLRPEWVADVDPQYLDPTWRRPALARRIAALGADIICLQEVEPAMFEYLSVEFSSRGYEGHFAQKKQGRPDGAAYLIRSSIAVHSVSALHFEDGIDGQEPSGHLALLLDIEWHGRRLLIATSHVRWGAPELQGSAHIGYREMIELLDATKSYQDRRIFCGDFNVTTDSSMIRELMRRGFVDAYKDLGGATCNAKRRAERIDFLMHGKALSATASALPNIEDETVLPNASEPSDHLPISAQFCWNTGTPPHHATDPAPDRTQR